MGARTFLRALVALLPLVASSLASAPVHAQAAGTPSAAQVPAAPAARVRSGFLVRPDTVEVGDAFLLVVSVAVPAGARIEWPAIDDTAAVVSMRAAVRVRSENEPNGLSRRETAEYELSAWDVGSLPIGLADATVRYGTTVLKVPMSGARVFVRSVLPGDTTLHVPKPAKGLFLRQVPWWERWWPAAAVVAALLVLWWLWRRRRRPAAAAPAKPVDVFARAVHDFERLDRLALADAGERGRAVALAVEILRTYLVARVPEAALSLTSNELLATTQSDSMVPGHHLAGLLTDADAIKFARRVVSGATARELTAEARAIVESVEHEHQARFKAAEEKRRLAARADQDARAAEEDAARKRSRRKSGVS